MSDRKTNQDTLPEEGPAAVLEAGAGRRDLYTRFLPGQSGNRKGRPKGARGRKQIVAAIAGETHVVNDGRKRRRRTTVELVLLSLRNRSVDGNVRAFRAVHTLLQQYAPELIIPEGQGYLILPEAPTPDEWAKLVYEHQRKGRGEPDREPDNGTSDP